MEWLNYHHLLYFWTVARIGSVSRASEELRLTQATVSAQVKSLEIAMGEKLFRRSGRKLILTDTGKVVFRYAGAPFLMPTRNTTARRSLDQWFDGKNIVPRIVAEFEDNALLKVFGQRGLGLFFAPSVIAAEVQKQYKVNIVGNLDDVLERFYAISLDRKLKHPAVVAISEAAKARLGD